MPGHDELFKSLFRAFFDELLHIVVPEIAEDLEVGETRFLNPELFTNLPAGARRQVDLAAEVLTRSGEPEQVVVHVEIEARMSWCAAHDRVAGRTVMTVEYAAFSLSQSRAEEYVRRPQRLAWGLAAVMSTTWKPAEHRLRCMEAIAHGEMSEFQRFLLYNCVGT